MPQELNLKTIVKSHGIPLTAFVEAGLNKPMVCQIKNHGIWPVHKDHSEIKSRIESVLKNHGVADERIAEIWDEEHHHDQAQNQDQTKNKKKNILMGGPKMLQEVVLQKVGLSKDPFTQELNDISDVFDAKPQMFIFQKMVDAAENRKILGVWGEVGSGKTTLKTLFLEQLRQKRNFLVSEPLINQKERLTPSGLIGSIIQDVLYGAGTIGNTGRLRAPRSLEAKSRFLRYHLTAKRTQGIRTVLIIDDAHDLTLDALKSLKRLHELQDGFKKLLSIILIGQPELNSLIKDYSIREVTARIDMAYMAPIDGMFDNYLRWKIEHADGGVEKIFAPDALHEMKHKITNATPLSINVLASHVIYMGFKMDAFPVNTEIVEMAWREMA